MAGLPKLAIYWASGCGGCEIAVVNLHERLLELCGAVELFFCPALVDTKRADVEALPDRGLLLTLFNGALRTDENVEWARLLRRKSELLVAYGACAYGGGIPALSNLRTRAEHWRSIYADSPTIEDPRRAPPREVTEVGQGVLRLPAFHASVRALASVVEVDYSIPGCPPEPHQLWAALQELLSGDPPPRGAVLGAGTSTVCDECARERRDKRLPGLRRSWQLEPNAEDCLLDQGLLCMGLATRSGCGALCPKVSAPCLGCYGPPHGVYDQAAKLVTTLGSLLDVAPLRELRDPAELAARIDVVLDTIPDIAGATGMFHGAARQSVAPLPDRADSEEP